MRAGAVSREREGTPRKQTAALWSLPILPDIPCGVGAAGPEAAPVRSGSDAPGRLWGACIDAHGELKKRQNSRDTTLV